MAKKHKWIINRRIKINANRLSKLFVIDEQRQELTYKTKVEILPLI